jgi:hypothetical protein
MGCMREPPAALLVTIIRKSPRSGLPARGW